MIGTYTTTPSDGIEVYGYNSHDGTFQFLQKTAIKTLLTWLSLPTKNFFMQLEKLVSRQGEQFLLFH